MKRQSTIILSIFIPVIISVMTVACRDSSGDQAGNNPSGERIVPVAGYMVIPRDLSRTVTVTGVIEPIQQITISAQMQGAVEEIFVEEGDRVTHRQIVARLRVDEQKAELQRAEAVFNRAQAHYERSRELLDRNLISAAEYDNARAELMVAQSDIDLWQTRVEFGTVRAPRDGVIVEKYIERGDAVSPNGPLFRLADTSTLVVRAGLSELDIVHLNPGNNVEVRVDALPDTRIDGVIRRIFPEADPQSRLVTVEVELNIPEAIHNVRSGNLARLHFSVDRRENALAVPSESLLASTEEETFIYIIDDERLVRRNIVPGVQRRNWTEILEGISEDDIVVAANPSNLSEGIRVRVTQWRDE
jgi:membrane fusion protein, multidrug efflux system